MVIVNPKNGKKSDLYKTKLLAAAKKKVREHLEELNGSGKVVSDAAVDEKGRAFFEKIIVDFQ